MANKAEKTAQAVEKDFLQIVTDVFQDNLKSVMLYGSYAGTRFVPGVSDVNVLVIVEEVVPEELAALSSRAYRLINKHRITPLILSQAEFLRSADVFPMEYLDIASRNRLLFGSDISATLEFSNRNLRHQVEHQLRGSLISLRQLVVAARGRKSVLRRDLPRWYGSVGAVMRGLLRLHGSTNVPENPADVMSTVNSTLGFEPGPFLQLLELREGGKVDSVELSLALLDRLCALVELVDTMESE